MDDDAEIPDEVSTEGGMSHTYDAETGTYTFWQTDTKRLMARLECTDRRGTPRRLRTSELQYVMQGFMDSVSERPVKGLPDINIC